MSKKINTTYIHNIKDGFVVLYGRTYFLFVNRFFLFNTSVLQNFYLFIWFRAFKNYEVPRFLEQCFLNFFGFVHLYYGVLHIIYPLYGNITLRAAYNHVTLIYASAVQEFCQERVGLNQKVKFFCFKTPSLKGFVNKLVQLKCKCIIAAGDPGV